MLSLIGIGLCWVTDDDTLNQSNISLLSLIIRNHFFQVVLPILRTLYNAPTSNNHHIYMSLIVLLILSEDDLFNTSVHDVAMTKQVNKGCNKSNPTSMNCVLAKIV